MKIVNLTNQTRNFIDRKGVFSVLEYNKDIPEYGESAMFAYFNSKMDVKRRQVLCQLNGQVGVICQAGAMQWMAGAIQAATDVKGVGDFAKKMLRGAVTNESAVKPRYTGAGCLMLEPTYKHLILLDVGEWGEVVIEDGSFLACEDTVQMRTAMRKSFSSAVAGGEGLFNLALYGQGVAVLESTSPMDELIEFEINNEELKIDGSMAVAWSGSLEFTVERTTKSLVGSAASGEGLVNVYRGTGKVLMKAVA